MPIRSAAEQECNPVGGIVDDDGSTGGNSAIIHALSLTGASLITQESGVVSGARNYGLAEVRKEWFVSLDSDDILHWSFLTEISRLVGAHLALHMLATTYISAEVGNIDSDNCEESPRDHAIEIVNTLPARWIHGASFYTSSLAVRVSALRALGAQIPVGEYRGEDADVWCRLAEQNPVPLGHVPLVTRVWTKSNLPFFAARSRDCSSPDFITRMIARVDRQSPSLTSAQRQSLTKDDRYHWVSLARVAISDGNRAQALAPLGKARTCGLHRRWCVTAVMACLIPRGPVYGWPHWRKRRRMIIK
ncbi:glycosyltransferase family A protein [Xylophilus sp. GOD-11R]|uniref:glycosyltransferase family A protein n=1 Tax=Xylophilus sp. GOD-11R TaxID=3089814 RepID=UPI00298C209A|nr:glycosyltransferase family A protein [Xylophilus sp. GOD-11R]WPB59375.1 glycosyltransferase family A protein [Xylophilus sp. GOD-11R]